MAANRLLIQPGAGVGPLIEGIDAATEIIQIVIFRFDRGDVEMALKRAAKRGVFVHALVAYTSSGAGFSASSCCESWKMPLASLMEFRLREPPWISLAITISS